MTGSESLPREIIEAANAAAMNLLPNKSADKYVQAYEKFVLWQKEKKIDSFSESVMLVYFNELSANYQSSTLWSVYSMLKSTINVNHGVDISTYQKLKAFLKKKSVGS